MTWAYLVVFNNSLGSQDEVRELLDSMSEVTYWYSCLPHCIFFTCTLGANDIADRFYARFGKSRGNRFLITEVHDDRQGWLPEKAWNLFTNPDNPRLE